MNHSRFGEDNNNWRGGRSITSDGYVIIRKPGHHLADVRGYVYEHRLVAEQKYGRELRSGEIVHHKNGDKTDNCLENIEIVASRAEHNTHHRHFESSLRLPGEDNPTISCLCGCGEQFLKFDKFGRPRRFVSGHNMKIGAR